MPVTPENVSIEMSSPGVGTAPRLKERTLSFRDIEMFSEMTRSLEESKAGQPDGRGSSETKAAALDVPAATATGKAKAKKGQLDKFLGSKSKLRWLRAGHPLTTRERLIILVPFLDLFP